jgi:hypothetical protein
MKNFTIDARLAIKTNLQTLKQIYNLTNNEIRTGWRFFFDNGFSNVIYNKKEAKEYFCKNRQQITLATIVAVFKTNNRRGQPKTNVAIIHAFCFWFGFYVSNQTAKEVLKLQAKQTEIDYNF